MIRSPLARLRLPSLPRLPVPRALKPSWPFALRLPPLSPLPLRRPPLPLTTAVIALLVLGPALILSRWSRPRAEGLEQVMGASSLLQSFPASPDRPVPQLWRERLGPDLARLLWSRQRGVWWQFWASHAESAPYLALPAVPLGFAQATLPPQALRIGDLVVFAENPTARQQLRVALRPLQRRSRGLLERCHQRLQLGQGVFWQADALGTLLGPVAPLLERYQVGCLNLALEGQALRWQGEAGPATAAPGSPPASQPAAGQPLGDGSLTALPPGQAVPPFAALGAPLSNQVLLELQGSSLDQLLAGLLSRQMIRDPLAARYGLEGERLERLRRAPFRLVLVPQVRGPFQATLELFITVGADRSSWEPVLAKVRASLLEQGLSPVAPSPAPAPPGEGTGTGVPPSPSASSPGSPAPSSPGSLASPRPGAPGSGPLPSKASGPGTPAPPAAAATSLWWRPDGSLVGGWRWLEAPASPPQLLLFLGPPPLIAGNTLPPPPPAALAPGESLVFRAQPGRLDALGLLGGELPGLVRRAEQVWLRSESPSAPAGAPVQRGAVKGTASPVGPAQIPAISRLTGRLQLGR